MIENTGAPTLEMPQTLEGAADFLVGKMADSENATPAQADSEVTEEIEEDPSDDVGSELEAQDGEGDDETELEATDEDKEHSPVDYIEIDGEQVSLEDVGKSYMRQASYTKKMQELAAQRQEFEAMRGQEIAALNAEREHIKKVLEAVGTQENSEPIDWTRLAQEDPLEYIAQKAKYDEAQARKSAFDAERQRLAQVTAQQQQAKMQEYLAQQKAKVIEAIPELTGKNGKEYRSDILTYLENSGYSKAELQQMADSRAVILADKARKYDALMGKDGPASKKVTTTPRVVRPKAQTTSKGKASEAKRAAISRAQKSGSIDDAVSALLA